jgi:carboxyl-terminal processing protease
VDDGSASASEIVAGALQDEGAATIVGIKTYGKGSVQEFEGLPDGSALKLTIAKWYTPKGRSIDHDGIMPDVVMEKLFDKKQTKNPTDTPEIVDLGLEKAMELLQANKN